MKRLSLVVIFFYMSEIVFGQNIAQRLSDSYEFYKEKSITQRRFKHKDLQPLLEKAKINAAFEVSEIGKSFEGRSISQLKYGKGAPSVLLWSQMHGDEATATMALLDIFNFLNATGDGFDDFRKKIFENSSLYFVPMLNPDGAERFQRRTAQEIDMNRDALRLQCPESQLLKKLQNTLKPAIGFNLHDQSPRYSAGATKNVAAVSFLATAYDYPRTVNSIRERAMKLIVGMNKTIQQFAPNQVGRYSDEHEPRAFGDNVAKWGTSVVLVESGGYKNDPEKQFIRKLNYVSILTALQAIAEGAYNRETRTDYDKIPQNEKMHFDLLIRNARVEINGQTYTTDIGINRIEKNRNEATTFVYESEVEDFGDLSIFYGIEEFDARGATITDSKGASLALKLKDVATFMLKKDKQITVIDNGFVK
jgi:Zinc carboxypeptidase